MRQWELSSLVQLTDEPKELKPQAPTPKPSLPLTTAHHFPGRAGQDAEVWWLRKHFSPCGHGSGIRAGQGTGTFSLVNAEMFQFAASAAWAVAGESASTWRAPLGCRRWSCNPEGQGPGELPARGAAGKGLGSHCPCRGQVSSQQKLPPRSFVSWLNQQHPLEPGKSLCSSPLCRPCPPLPLGHAPHHPPGKTPPVPRLGLQIKATTCAAPSCSLGSNATCMGAMCLPSDLLESQGCCFLWGSCLSSWCRASLHRPDLGWLPPEGLVGQCHPCCDPPPEPVVLSKEEEVQSPGGLGL